MKKLTTNHKIVIGLVAGGVLAWFFLRNKSSEDKKSTESLNSDKTPLAKTREEKIEYILDNLEATTTETQSGFSGDRFEFDPTIGYAIPIGKVDVVGAGEEMIISRDGNFANEIYFNVDGEPTDNPVEEAVALLNELSDEELNIVYACVVAKKKDPNLNVSELVAEMPIEERKKGGLSSFLQKRMNDVKSIKKSPKWQSFWSKRREDGSKFMSMFRRNADRKRVSTKDVIESKCGRRPLFGVGARRWRACVDELKNEESSSNIVGRVNRSKFKNEVVNRGY